MQEIFTKRSIRLNGANCQKKINVIFYFPEVQAIEKLQVCLWQYSFQVVILPLQVPPSSRKLVFSKNILWSLNVIHIVPDFRSRLNMDNSSDSEEEGNMTQEQADKLAQLQV